MSMQDALSTPALVADLLKGGRELRPAQVEMAALVSRALSGGESAVIEAATGVGKSAAYLVPVIRSGKTVIVSTANKALQEQLYEKDIPFLQKHVQPFGAAMIKGVGNYLCRDRLDSARKDLRLFDRYPELQPVIDAIEQNDTFAGDFESLGFPIAGELRSRINGERDECAWEKCNFFNGCYIRAMRERARLAQVIIVNHTLLLLDAAAEGAILPDRDLIVIDEAHHLAGEASSAFTTIVRPSQVASLLSLQRVQAHSPEALRTEVAGLAARLWNRIEQVPLGNASKLAFKEPVQEGLALAAKINDLADTLRSQRPGTLTDKETALYDKLIQRTRNLGAAVRLVFDARPDGGYVRSIERIMTSKHHPPSLQACATPLDVAPWLKEKLFDKIPVIIMTSATLATIGPNPAKPEENGKPNFAYYRRQIGLDPVDRPTVIERILPQVFDYARNALLYVPRDVPEPVYGAGEAAQHYESAIAAQMQRLVQASRGRAFLLFSSRRMLDEVYSFLAPHAPYRLLRQGDMNRAELLAAFHEERGVLLGLKTFWEGVDIAGEALSLVVIDKLPFGVPDDPVHAAVVEGMKARGENWFGGYVLPQVVLQLKQGVGRLLRTKEDRGVMAILDARLYSKGYGKQVFHALPPARRTMQLSDVEQFFSV